MSMDSERGVLSMAPLLDRITPAVVSINVRSTAKAPKLSNRNEELLERFLVDACQMSQEKNVVWAQVLL